MDIGETSSGIFANRGCGTQQGFFGGKLPPGIRPEVISAEGQCLEREASLICDSEDVQLKRFRCKARVASLLLTWFEVASIRSWVPSRSACRLAASMGQRCAVQTG